MKVIDFDGLFDEYVSEFLSKIAGKYSAEEVEDIQPKLFEKFSNLKIKNIGGLTPSEYYNSQKDRLIEILKEHVKRDIPVNGFLQNAIVEHVSAEVLIDNLNENFDEIYIAEIVNLLYLKNCKSHFNRLIDLLFNKKLGDELKNLILDILCENANLIASEICSRPIEEDFLLFAGEILSCVTEQTDQVVSKFEEIFLSDKKHVFEFCSFIIKFNNDKLLPALYQVIEKDVSYAEFKELKIAIEWLGGNYEKERDFSFDKTYKLLKGE